MYIMHHVKRQVLINTAVLSYTFWSKLSAMIYSNSDLLFIPGKHAHDNWI